MFVAANPLDLAQAHAIHRRYRVAATRYTRTTPVLRHEAVLAGNRMLAQVRHQLRRFEIDVCESCDDSPMIGEKFDLQFRQPEHQSVTAFT